MKHFITISIMLLSIVAYSQSTTGTKVTATVVPNDYLDDVATHDEYFGKGGIRTVQTEIERDAIKASRRNVGMIVYVKQNDTYYRLIDSISNSNWQLLKFRYIQITGGLDVSGSQTDLFQVSDLNDYNRFLVTNKGLIVSGRKHKNVIGVDGLYMIGSTNSLDGINSGSMGYNAFCNSDTSYVLGAFIDSTGIDNQLTIGSGMSQSQRLKNLIPNSVVLAANDTAPALILTKGQTKVNSSLVIKSATPASATATGVAGQIAWDANYYYVCTATNTWKRISLTTW